MKSFLFRAAFAALCGLALTGCIDSSGPILTDAQPVLGPRLNLQLYSLREGHAHDPERATFRLERQALCPFRRRHEGRQRFLGASVRGRRHHHPVVAATAPADRRIRADAQAGRRRLPGHRHRRGRRRRGDPRGRIASIPAGRPAASRRASNCSPSRAPRRRSGKPTAGSRSGSTTRRARSAATSAEPMAARTLKTSDLARGIKAGDRATLARAITLIESKRADHRKAAHHLVQELLPLTGKAVRLGITGAPGAGKSTTIDVLGTTLTGRGPQGRRAGGRSVLEPHRRLDPRRQDAHGAARQRPECLRAALARLRHARRRRRQDARDHAAVRGRRLRRGAGGDRRHRPVGDRGRRHDRFLSGADAAGRRRRVAGPQKRHRRAGRHGRGQQGRRRQYRARQTGGRRISRRAQYPGAVFADLVAAGGHLFGAHRQRHRRAVDPGAGRTRN